MMLSLARCSPKEHILMYPYQPVVRNIVHSYSPVMSPGPADIIEVKHNMNLLCWNYSLCMAPVHPVPLCVSNHLHGMWCSCPPPDLNVGQRACSVRARARTTSQLARVLSFTVAEWSQRTTNTFPLSLSHTETHTDTSLVLSVPWGTFVKYYCLQTIWGNFFIPELFWPLSLREPMPKSPCQL